MSLTELSLILFVALILFGPEDLPVIARTLGKMVYQIRKYSNEITKEFQDALETPSKVINDALQEAPPKAMTSVENKADNSDTEELLSYEDNSQEEKTVVSSQETNPLADLPSDIISYSKEPQAGE